MKTLVAVFLVGFFLGSCGYLRESKAKSVACLSMNSMKMMLVEGYQYADQHDGYLPEDLVARHKTPAGRNFIDCVPVKIKLKEILAPAQTPLMMEPIEEFAEFGWVQVIFVDGHGEQIFGHFRSQQELYDLLISRCSGEARIQVEGFLKALQQP